MLDKKVAIVILNYKGWLDTIECLESLFKNKYKNFSLLIVDNYSNDSSVENIENWLNGKIEFKINNFLNSYDYSEKYILPIKYAKIKSSNHSGKISFTKDSSNTNNMYNIFLIEADENYGYSGGNNIGIKYAVENLECEYIWLLNNDTIVSPDALIQMVEKMNTSINPGVVGSVIKYYNSPDLIEKTCGQGQILTNFIFGKTLKIMKNNKLDDIMGASFLMSVNTIKKVGYLDEDYFLYREESDYCWKVREAGLNLICADKSTVYHKSAASSGGKGNARSYYYLSRNTFLFFRKNIKNKFVRYSFFIIFILNRIAKIIFLKMQSKNKQAIAVLNGIFDGLKDKRGKGFD